MRPLLQALGVWLLRPSLRRTRPTRSVVLLYLYYNTSTPASRSFQNHDTAARALGSSPRALDFDLGGRVLVRLLCHVERILNLVLCGGFGCCFLCCFLGFLSSLCRSLLCCFLCLCFGVGNCLRVVPSALKCASINLSDDV